MNHDPEVLVAGPIFAMDRLTGCVLPQCRADNLIREVKDEGSSFCAMKRRQRIQPALSKGWAGVEILIEVGVYGANYLSDWPTLGITQVAAQLGRLLSDREKVSNEPVP